MSHVTLLQRLATGFSGGFVLAFHEIAPDRMAGFVDSLWPAQPVHLSELVKRSKQRKSTSGLFAVTVDDGVGDNVRGLARLAEARGWPITFYLPTQYLDTGDGMVFQWWRLLKPLLPRRRIELKSGVVDFSAPGSIEEMSRRMEQRWHSQPLQTYLPLIMDLIEVVIRETGLSRSAIRTASPITWPEVTELSGNDLIRFESHGISHAAMSSLTSEELVSEMKRSRDTVADHTGRDCRHLAYPFGSWESIGSRTVTMAERFYDSAVTMSLGHVDFANPWMLPRVPLYPENSTLFARLKIVLKCSSLAAPIHGRAAA